MALDQLSEAKKKAFKEMVFSMTNQGKNFRQVARRALKEFNVKLTLPKK